MLGGEAKRAQCGRLPDILVITSVNTSSNIFAYLLLNYMCVVIIVSLKNDIYLQQDFSRGDVTFQIAILIVVRFFDELVRSDNIFLILWGNKELH